MNYGYKFIDYTFYYGNKHKHNTELCFCENQLVLQYA